MKLTISTSVKSDWKKVKEGFNETLFLKLSPPFPKVRLLQFDGCKTDDKVIIELNFLLFKQIWESEIIEDGESETQWYFIDIGKKLPFFLKSWRHRHLIQSVGKKSVIIDEVTFTTGTLLTDLITLPAIWLQFLYRKPIYQKIFQ